MVTAPNEVSVEGQHPEVCKQLECEQMFDAVPDLVMVVDADRTIIKVNRAMAERCGCTRMEMAGRKCFEVIHGTDSPPATCPHAGTLCCDNPFTMELPIERLHGIFKVIISPICNTEGQVIAAVHVAHDITEAKRYEELLTAKQKELEEINSSLESRIEKIVAELRSRDDILIQQNRLNAMGEMISAMAHQWRQPLNNIGLIVQGLQIAYKANDLSAEEIDRETSDTMAVIQQMSQTINDFRNFFSREYEPGNFVINELLARALSFVEPSMKRKGIRVEIDEEPDVTAEGYPNEYAQAFLNIALNARDVLLDRRVAQPFVKVHIFRENGRSIVTVGDNGGGIPEDIMPRIFDPYFTTGEHQRRTGLGLFMAKMIVEKKMHGRLSVGNVNGGAEFRIEI